MTPVGEYVVYYIAAPGIPLITTASSSVLFCHLRLPAVFEACFPYFILMTSLPFSLWMPFYFIAVSTVVLVRQWPVSLSICPFHFHIPFGWSSTASWGIFSRL